jgi:hypothetical protein
MAGLTDKAGGISRQGNAAVERAHQAWQESMLRQLEVLRTAVRTYAPAPLAARCGGIYTESQILLKYWGGQVQILWPSLEAISLPDGKPCSIFDVGVLLYYLHTADDSPLADRWISFRELPGGAFYHLAFQGYSGDQMARAFSEHPAAFQAAAKALDGWHLSGIAEYAYAFQPLPCIRLAAIFWPGDDEFPARGQVLFDAAASHYMTTDGLALLGAGLARRLESNLS